ncbi:MAG: gamma-glutamyl-gamma-aminobutyrate hydrolase [Rhodobacteraceae bacterium]|nr:gamma-glutamyl-gamma-aminobutyrate hydrolase [Paracoccaceae bacterium]
MRGASLGRIAQGLWAALIGPDERPVIGVTCSRRSGWRIFPLMRLSVAAAGGRALRWDEAKDVDLDAVDGVVIGGGDDISAELYGGELIATSRVDPERDRMELAVIRGALARGLPMLGICRGAQMLNIALGGNLDQDAYATYGSSDPTRTILPRKTVQVAPDSRLAALAGSEPMVVNSLHSQAVDRLGEGLRAVAHDPSGMIQAVERDREPFALGVQWHPEHLVYARRQRRLFRGLVRAAAAGKARRPHLEAVDAIEA